MIVKSHTWVEEEVDSGHLGMNCFWVCKHCGAAGGPNAAGIDMRNAPFLADGTGLKLSLDCDEAKKQIAAHKLKASAVVEDLITCAQARGKIDEMSDGEIADLLDKHVLNHTSMISPAYEVVDAAIDRLRRSGGGPMPEDRPRHDEQTFELARCNHCLTRVVNPTSDECPTCKGEIDPVSKILQPGSHVLSDHGGSEWRNPDGSKVYSR
jgi:hypothetical protein